MSIKLPTTKYITIFLVLAVLSTTFGFASNLNKVEAAGANYTSGSGKIYKNGNEIQIKGLNWFGFEEAGQLRPGGTWTNVDWLDTLDRVESMGFNAIRVPFCPDTLTSASVGYISNVNEELVNKNARQVFTTFLQELNRREIYFLLDHHRPECTEITPLWYTGSYSEAEWIADLVDVAETFAFLEYFMGIDLSNEPYGATWGAGAATDWNKAAERAGEAVLAANPNILIFVEGVGPNDGNSTCNWTENTFWGENLVAVECVPIDTNKIEANKLVLSPHVYGPAVFEQSYFSAGNYPDNMPAIWDEHWGYLIDQGYTLAIGEWGGRYTGSDKVWQDAFVDYLIDRGICHSFHWSLNPESGDTGGILQTDWQTPESAKLSNIQRLFNNCSTDGGGSTSSATSSSGTTSSTTSSAGAQTPFGGTAAAIEGRIEAENFDEGGAEVAYSDSDTLNDAGATYRTGGVDIADYGSNRYVVASTEPNEWLEYTVNIAETGTYSISAFAVTADVDDRSFELYLDGELLTTITIPVQSSWDDFVTETVTDIPLSEGEHIVRVAFTDYGVNLDYLDFALISLAPCIADYNDDRTVDSLDLGIFALNYKKGDLGGGSNLDLVNNDNQLTAADFSKLAEVYGRCVILTF